MEHTTQKQFVGKLRISLLVSILVMVMGGLFFSATAFGQTADHSAPALTAEQAGVQKFGLVAAAIAFGLGAIGAGIAIASVGAAAMGTIGEKPELAGQALIFIALAEGLVVFGFITALMILGKI